MPETLKPASDADTPVENTETAASASPAGPAEPPRTVRRPAGGAQKKRFALLDRGWPTPVAILLAVFLYWIVSLNFDAFVFPGLPQVWDALKSIVIDDRADIATTVVRYLVAFGVAIIAGWAIGLAMGAYRRIFGRLMESITSIIQAVPAISWILLAVLWISSVEARIGFVTFIISFPFFVVAVYGGIRDMDKDLLDAIEQFRPSRLQTLRILLMPQSIVSLMTAMRSTAAMTLKIMVLAELLAANNGIGRAMGNAQADFRLDLVFAWTVILIAMNFILIKLISILEGVLLHWRSEAVVR